MTNSCRSCGEQDLFEVLDLGLQPLANNLLREQDLDKPEPRFALVVQVCRSCRLMQLRDLVPPVELFSEYLYFTSFSSHMLAHAKQASQKYIEMFKLNQEHFVVEVASNDGYLLKNFVAAGIPCLGIDPAANIAAVANKAGVPTRVDFFAESVAKTVAKEQHKADLILGNNVFAHAPQINDFVAGLKTLLAPGGHIVLEFPYAAELIENNEFDTIYHEHVYYFMLTPLLPLFARHGLQVQHVEQLPIHGGSLRLFACHQGEQAVDKSVAQLIAQEAQLGVNEDDLYTQLSDRVAQLKSSLLSTLAQLKADGHNIAVYGASAKGSTLLNYLDPPAGSLDFIVDKSTYKQGLFSPGLHLPIDEPTRLEAEQPDYTLLLAWNLAEEILAQAKDYREAGGRFIIPIPKVQVL